MPRAGALPRSRPLPAVEPLPSQETIKPGVPWLLPRGCFAAGFADGGSRRGRLTAAGSFSTLGHRRHRHPPSRHLGQLGAEHNIYYIADGEVYLYTADLRVS